MNGRLNRKVSTIVTLAMLVLALGLPLPASGATSPPTTFEYDDIDLSGGSQSGHFPTIWDLTACDMQIGFEYDGNGLVDDLGGDAHAWAQIGVREVGHIDFNPTWDVEGAGVWLATDYDWNADTFDPDPAGSPTLDIDDKLILQKAGGHGEADYNLPSTPPNPGWNHRVWFDRDGVDQWQAQNPLAVDGGTYNTNGTYEITINLHADNAASGTAHMTINGLNQGFETDGDWKTMELTPAGMTFTGDMTQMQVFYGLYGYGASHSASFNEISVTGCIVLEDGMATGGGWFVPDISEGISEGGKATFGFVAKQSEKHGSTGQLEFQYHADGLSLKSSTYDWVTIASTQAMFEGEGSLNGQDGYRFRVRAVDGDEIGTGVDRFEIRIWTGSGSFDSPTYRAEGNLGGGQIVVHKK
jgi:hypothetical protein